MKYEEIKEIAKSLKKEDIYSLLNEQYINIFQQIDMNENSHTELLKWLLDVNNKDKNSIQCKFLSNFINFLIENNYLPSDFNVENLFNNFNVINHKEENIDLLMYTNSEDFVCVIENKLDAKINCSTDGATQLEKYKNYVEKHYHYQHCKTKLYILLCPKDITKEKVKKICQNKKNNDIYLNNEIITNKECSYLLENLDYKMIEYNDIVLILHQTLSQIKPNYKNNLPKNNLLFNLPEDVKKGLDIYKILNNIKTVYEILAQYIEYWEIYDKYVNGYSKIIDFHGEDGKIYSIYYCDLKEIFLKNYENKRQYMKTFIFNESFENQKDEFKNFIDGIDNIKSVNVDFCANKNMTMNEVQSIFSKISEIIGECNDIKFSCTYDVKPEYLCKITVNG